MKRINKLNVNQYLKNKSVKIIMMQTLPNPFKQLLVNLGHKFKEIIKGI